MIPLVSISLCLLIEEEDDDEDEEDSEPIRLSASQGIAGHVATTGEVDRSPYTHLQLIFSRH